MFRKVSRSFQITIEKGVNFLLPRHASLFFFKKILQLLEYTYMTNDLFLLNVVFLWLLSPGVWGVGNNLFKILLEKRLKETFADDVEMLWLLKFSMFSSFSDSKLSVTVTSNLASWRLRVFMEEYLACLLGRFWLVSDLDLACIEPTLVAISTCKKARFIYRFWISSMD